MICGLSESQHSEARSSAIGKKDRHWDGQICAGEARYERPRAGRAVLQLAIVITFIAPMDRVALAFLEGFGSSDPTLRW
jgi:hypothetical protein